MSKKYTIGGKAIRVVKPELENRPVAHDPSNKGRRVAEVIEENKEKKEPSAKIVGKGSVSIKDRKTGSFIK